MKKVFIATVVLLCTTVVAWGGVAKKKAAPASVRPTVPARQSPVRATPAAAGRKASGPVAQRPVAAPSGYRPAGTIAFANLEVISRAVAGIAGPGSKDQLLTQTIPSAIRGQYAARLFGPMRPGAHGVAVCYVDPAIAARVSAARKASGADIDRVKRWCVVYPTTVSRDMILQRRPDAVPEANGSLRLPPSPQSRRTLWAWFSPDGQWAVLAPSPAMAVQAFAASAHARTRPLGGDLAYVQMDAAGARAVFGTDACAGGSVAVRMAPRGLELHGQVRMAAGPRAALPPHSLAFANVPANAPLFGVTTVPGDVRSAEVFAIAGPTVSAFIRKSLAYAQGPGANSYYLIGGAASSAGAPASRLDRILPEAKGTPFASNVMFCSPTTVLRIYLPKVAATLMPLESAKLQMALRMLRPVRGEGLGVMGWREGNVDKFFIRVSKDELWGTANLWSLMLL